MEGGFRRVNAIKYCEEHFKSREDVKFDAVLAANDLMAAGCMQHLQKIGVKIPEDVKIIGFDETSQATKVTPRLSTVDQELFEQGYYAGQYCMEILEGKNPDKCRVFPVRPVYRQSCGCIPLSNIENVYLNKDLKMMRLTEIQLNRKEDSELYFNFLSSVNEINSLFDMLHSVYTLRKLSYVFKYLLDNARISSAALCFYENPVNLYSDDDFSVPENMYVSILVDREKNIQEFEPGIYFNPKKEAIPHGVFDDSGGTFIFQPVFSGEKNYGYILCKLENSSFPVYSVTLKILSAAIAQSYEYTSTVNENMKLSDENIQLQEDNTYLSKESKTDELTGILNRRGFLELAQKTIEIALDMKSTGLVFFADVDGLKIINDTYGHKMGDVAIKSVARVIKEALRSSDVVGRLSGDEFGAVAVGLKTKQIPELRKKIFNICKNIQREKNLPFELSFSFGAEEFTRNSYNLKELMFAADKRLYVEKKAKHAARKKMLEENNA